MTFKEAEDSLRSELTELYPKSEIEAMSQVIFRHFFGFSRFQLHQNLYSVIPQKSEFQIYNIIHQLKQYRPLQYILGETEFYGLRFTINENVLIPRPETEELVQWIVDDCRSNDHKVILDIGTGSGCIAVSLAKSIPDAIVSAIDVSPLALNTAKENAELNSITVDFKLISILEPTFEKFPQYDVIVSNPPYVTHEQKSEMLSNVLNYEPHLALFVPDSNPLVFYQAIAGFAKVKLNPNGFMYFEINEKYPEETADCIQKLGFQTELKLDINNKYRMLKAWRNE